MVDLHPLSFSAHSFLEVATAPFDTHEYSKMKFGSDRSARKLANDLAYHFFNTHSDILQAHHCVVVPAPGTVVPVASTLMSMHFMNRINHMMATRGLRTVDWTLIHRNLSYQQDYHHLDKETRRKLLAGDQIFLNRDFVKDKMLVFIDDVVITGAHEEKLGNFLRENGLTNPHAFVTFARYLGADPTIEARLNHALIKNGRDVIALAEQEFDHRMTTRAIRLMLEMQPGEFRHYLGFTTPHIVESAYHAAINKGYHEVEEYRENFAFLSERATHIFA